MVIDVQVLISLYLLLIGCSEHDCDLHGGWAEEKGGSNSRFYTRWDRGSCRRASQAVAGWADVNKHVYPHRMIYLNPEDSLKLDRVIASLFNTPFFQITTFDGGRLMALSRIFFASMLVQLEKWIAEFGIKHSIVQSMIREAQKEGFNLKALLDCGEGIRKDYISRNSMCNVTDDVPVAQILNLCVNITTELSGLREVILTHGQIIKSQQQELKELKIHQLQTQDVLTKMEKNFLYSQAALLEVQTQLSKVSPGPKRRNPNTAIASDNVSEKRLKVRVQSTYYLCYFIFYIIFFFFKVTM